MKIRSTLVTSVAAGLLLSGVSSAVDSPDVRRLGASIAQYRDKAFQMTVSWRYPQLYPGDRWTFLEAWMMPISDKGVTINREDVSLYLPDGTEIPLASQSRVNESLPEIRRIARIGNEVRDPIAGYSNVRNGTVRIGFQDIRGRSVAFDECGIPPNWAAVGDLFFENPKGTWEKGIYTLSLKNKEIDVKIPMAIGITGKLERVS